jgi:hypothetical protein
MSGLFVAMTEESCESGAEVWPGVEGNKSERSRIVSL